MTCAPECPDNHRRDDKRKGDEDNSKHLVHEVLVIVTPHGIVAAKDPHVKDELPAAEYVHRPLAKTGIPVRGPNVPQYVAEERS